MITMNNYIEALCEGRPLDLPNYNEDTKQWEIHFEENRDDFHPYFQRDIISYSCETADEACELYNHYIKNPIQLEDEEVTTEDKATV